MPRFQGMGVDRRRLETDIPYSLPTGVFNPDAEPLDLARAEIWSGSAKPAGSRSFDSKMPVIGVYGKVAVSKGTFDLIASLGGLAREGFDFRGPRKIELAVQ
jgi:hypothetical protein